MMLGWPCVAYPHLIFKEKPIKLTWDQTALVAGFLMEGNAIGTLFSSTNIIGSKAAVITSSFLQLIGWIIMLYYHNIFGLFVARCLVGFGHGYGIGQLKKYVKETNSKNIAKAICNYLPISTNFGVLLEFVIGSYVSYNWLPLYSAIVPTLCLLFFGIVTKSNKVHPAEKIPREMKKESSRNLMIVITNKEVRVTLYLIFLLVFVQQYTGGPANIVYAQIIFAAGENSYPKLCSVIYGISNLVFSIITQIFSNNFKRKSNLITSCFLTLTFTTGMSLYFFFKEYLLEKSEQYSWMPLILLVFFNFFHSFGLGAVPSYIVKDRCSDFGEDFCMAFLTIHFSISAVLSTKFFQMLFTYYDMYIGYLLFVAVALFGLITITLFFKESKIEVTNENFEKNSKIATIEIAKL